MNPNRKLNLKDNSKKLKKDIIGLVSKRVQQLRSQALEKSRNDVITYDYSSESKKIGMKLLSGAVSDYYNSFTDESNEVFMTSDEGANDRNQQNHNDSLESAVTDNDTESIANYFEKSQLLSHGPTDENLCQNNTSFKTFNESELIEMLGLDSYLEIMCHIEEEIKNECLSPPVDDEIFDDDFIDNDFVESLQWEQLICPNCRTRTMQPYPIPLTASPGATNNSNVNIDTYFDPQSDNITGLSCKCGLTIKLLSQRSGALLEVFTLREILANIFDRHLGHCSQSSSCSSRFGNINDRNIYNTCSSNNCFLYFLPESPASGDVNSHSGGIIHVKSTACSFDDVISW